MTSKTVGSPRMASSAVSVRWGSTPSRSRWPKSLVVVIRRTKIAKEVMIPMAGSAQGRPRPTPMTPTTTASEVSPSARAWMPGNEEPVDHTPESCWMVVMIVVVAVL